MATLFTPGLDRNTEMQKQPLGTFSALRRPSPIASQYKRQGEMYGQALRTLSRAARRGDPHAALQAIDVRNHANDEGFTPGGIGRSEDFGQKVQDREQRLMRDNETMQRADQAIRGNLDRRISNLGGGATQGAGRGNPISRNTPVNGTSQGNPPNGPEVAGPPSYLKNTRNSAALDILEGAAEGGDMDQYDRGRAAAEDLGVKNATSIIHGDRNLKYRQTLDSALGQAKSPEEIAALKERGIRNGISPKAFDRRAKWWDSNRA